MPASLWAKSTMTTARPEPEQVQPAGRALGDRREVDAGRRATCVERGAQPARAAGRGQRVGDVVPREPADA